MKVIWSRVALKELSARMQWVSEHNPAAAQKLYHSIRTAAISLEDNPKKGTRIEQIYHKEIRCLLIKSYELHYQVTATNVRIIKVFHTREDRPH